MRTPTIPPGAEVVRTYAQLDAYVEAFFAGMYNLLIVIGGPGLAKSTNFERRLGFTSHLVKGWTAPLQAYLDCYEHRNKLLIFDDAESLWQKPAGRILLRSLCEHKPWKTLQWASTTRALAAVGVPRSFETSSKVAIIANRFVFGDACEFEAVADRAHIVFFDPLPAEIHQQAAAWFWDQEIYDFLGERLHLIRDPSARVYMKAAERKQAGGNWREMIEEVFCHDRTMRLVQTLETDPACTTAEQKAEKFIELTGACRATYFNLRRRLKKDDQLIPLEKVAVPKCVVQGSPPVQPDIEQEVAKAQEEDHARHEPPAGEGFLTTPETALDEDGLPRGEGLYGRGADEAKPLRIGRGNEKEPRQRPPDDDLEGWLQRQLRKAIRREDYERAARLRDQIARMKKDQKPED